MSEIWGEDVLPDSADRFNLWLSEADEYGLWITTVCQMVGNGRTLRHRELS
jgi:hypothetical protein